MYIYKASNLQAIDYIGTIKHNKCNDRNLEAWPERRGIRPGVSGGMPCTRIPKRDENMRVFSSNKVEVCSVFWSQAEPMPALHMAEKDLPREKEKKRCGVSWTRRG